MARVLIVSNRLPVTVRADADGVEVQPSVGGVATGLWGPHQRSGGLWIGWPGLVDPLPEKDQNELASRLEAMRLVQVPLTREEVQRYYESYSNGVLWPLFHYFVGELPLEVQGFEDYERVNRRFADAVVAHHRPGDLVWIHDYQLMHPGVDCPGVLRLELQRPAGGLLGLGVLVALLQPERVHPEEVGVARHARAPVGEHPDDAIPEVERVAPEEVHEVPGLDGKDVARVVDQHPIQRRTSRGPVSVDQRSRRGDQRPLP